MSRKRLIATLFVISSCLALVIALAAWTFPLKAQGPSNGIVGGVIGGVPGGVTQGVSHGVVQGIVSGAAGGVSNGIAGGISGAISGGITTRASTDEPSVDVSTIWTDTAKRGSMAWMISGNGSLVQGADPRNLVARLALPRSMAAEVKEGQKAVVTTEKDPLSMGRVSSVVTACSDACAVDIALLDPLPQGTKPGLGVIVRIDLGRLDDILYIGRPVRSPANSEISLFKISSDGAEAVRTSVKLGRASVSTIEVLDGLKEGDKVIISDMSGVANAERIRLTDEKHLTSH